MEILATYEMLKRFERESPDASSRLEKAKVLAGKTVFLSHATADDDLVPGVLLILDNHGGRVYVDHHDPSLPGSDLHRNRRASENRRSKLWQACRTGIAEIKGKQMDPVGAWLG